MIKLQSRMAWSDIEHRSPHDRLLHSLAFASSLKGVAPPQQELLFPEGVSVEYSIKGARASSQPCTALAIVAEHNTMSKDTSIWGASAADGCPVFKCVCS